MNTLKQFGAKPSPSDIEKYRLSRHWKDGHFENGEVTKMDVNLLSIPKILCERIFESKDRDPASSLPIIPFEKIRFESSDDAFKSIWFGHSAILMRLNRTNIFIDPMLGPNAAPISPFPVKRFSKDTLAIIDELPDLDIVLLSHDHYDHLDYDSIQKIKKNTRRFFVALGDARHLVKWGIDENIITEFDWWDEQRVNKIKITFTPSKHFSGRGLKDRSKSLWGGWLLETQNERIWFSGDGGYGKHFVEIGNKIGPVDFAFMECGQYHELWHQIHMYPEETVQAAIDAKAKKIMPVHWGAFALAQHSWTEPVERFVAEASKRNVDFILPKLGEEINLQSEMRESWWRMG